MATEKIHQTWTAYAPPVFGTTPAAAIAEQGIRDTCARIADAWSLGDASMLPAALAAECDHMTLTRVRHVKRGRAALVASWDEAFTRRDPRFSVRMKVMIQSMRLL